MGRVVIRRSNKLILTNKIIEYTGNDIRETRVLKLHAVRRGKPYTIRTIIRVLNNGTLAIDEWDVRRLNLKAGDVDV